MQWRSRRRVIRSRSRRNDAARHRRQDLMPEGEDFGVAPVTGGDKPSEPPDDQVADFVRERHSRATVPAERASRHHWDRCAVGLR